MRHKILNLILWGVFGFIVLWVISIIVNILTPYSYNVNQTYRAYEDMCVGSDVLHTIGARDVRPSPGFRARISQELFRFEDGEWYEVDINRNKEVYVQDNGGIIFHQDWRYDAPVTETGLYGVGGIATIYPVPFLPFIPKTRQWLPEENQFYVVDCN